MGAVFELELNDVGNTSDQDDEMEDTEYQNITDVSVLFAVLVIFPIFRDKLPPRHQALRTC